MNPENKPLTGNHTSAFRNWISFIGMVVARGALFSFLLLFILDALAKFSNPYVSILTYMGVPAFLIGGILLTVFGAWRERRRRSKGGGATSLQIDLNNPRERRTLVVFIAGRHRFHAADRRRLLSTPLISPSRRSFVAKSATR
ncbi:MAG: hypothetical protein WDM80_10420 [Limisphaerales bacterium]